MGLAASRPNRFLYDLLAGRMYYTLPRRPSLRSRFVLYRFVMTQFWLRYLHVIAVTKFFDEKGVLRLANDTSRGLAAAAHTQHYERTVRVTNKLKADTAWVNMLEFVHWSIPFGGFKQSGIVRQCGEAPLERCTETKAVYLNMGIQAPS